MQIHFGYLVLQTFLLSTTGLPQEILQPEPQKQSVWKKDQVHVSHGREAQRNAKLLWSERDGSTGPSHPECDEGAEVWCSRRRKLQLLSRKA